uniref:Tetratricopeptide repeat protein 7 N-terminal domain-containing protein n=1 Tax=Glossina palpalis gambiensis TaxID=67801 RepID=A0A1B0BK70_9MUSC
MSDRSMNSIKVIKAGVLGVRRSSAPTTPFELDRRMDTILETALQLASILLIKEGKLQEAANRYRTTLKPIEAKTNHYD